MKNLVQILPNCFILYTEAGFRKLLKKLHCYGGEIADNKFFVRQCSNDENAFYKKSYPQYNNETGKPLLDKNGNQLITVYNCHIQYPIKYPCIISYEDFTFEISQINFYIKYIPNHLNLDDFIEFDFKEDKIEN